MKELDWQETALLLRKYLFREHEMKCIELEAWPHPKNECTVCSLLEKTRWCMGPLNFTS